MTLDEVQSLDANDPLGKIRLRFTLPNNLIYLDGNSLGPLPTAVKDRTSQLVDREWGQDLISSWNKNNWIELPQRCGDKIATLIGAEAGQVICCDSVSVNLYKLLATALQLNPERQVVLSTHDNFPTNVYMAQGLQKPGSESSNLQLVDEDGIESALSDEFAVLMLTHVNFRTGNALDIQTITQLAHDKGILVLWDLSHSTGVIPLGLDQWDVDFAVGCGYKYLNGGPGAPAFVYVAKRHILAAEQPLQGWMGHAAPFDFNANYTPAPDMTKFLCGTAPILSMNSLDAALDVYADISIASVRSKSVALTELFIQLVQAKPVLSQLKLVTCDKPEGRGSQLSFSHPDAYAICQALIANAVIGDFRNPDLLRFGFSPLFLRFEDIWNSVEILAGVISSEAFKQPRFAIKQRVT